jgi:hypothetical protein
MADDRNLRGPQDRQRINLSEDYEVTYWSKKWGVSPEQLAEAVRGPGRCQRPSPRCSAREP